MVEKDNALFRGCVFEDVFERDGYRVYRMENATGWGEMETLRVAPGIQIVYNHLHMATCYQKAPGVPDCMSINYCRRGCYEFDMRGGGTGILGEGDMSVNDFLRQEVLDSRIPLRYYEGLTLGFELEAAQESLNRFAPDARIDLRAVPKRFCAGDDPFLMRSRPEIEHIFGELYRADDRIRKPYTMLKVVELLLFLSIAEPCSPLPRFSPEVVRQTKAVYAHLIRNPLEKLTVEQLSRKFHLSDTNLRCCFRALYGQPLATFARTERLKWAARALLECPERSIGEIAALAGYQNQSKFAAAFKARFGKTPFHYRHPLSDNLEPKYNEGE